MIVLLVAGTTVAATADTAQKLGDPIAYCLSTLAECTPDKQRAFDGKVPGDLRAVNGGTQDPVTLVYQLPDRDSHSDYAIMVAGGYINHCFRFDVFAPTVCTERKLTQINIPPEALQLLSQAVHIPDVRIRKPNVIWGTSHALQAQSTSERDTIKLLTGWYAFICLAALFQLMTQRNQQLSICLALLMVTVILRINTTVSGGFSGIVFINPDISRVVEYLTLPLLTAFIVHYYAQLVGSYLLRIRLVFYALCILAGTIILLATQPAHILLSLQIAQVVVLVAFVLGLLCVFKAIRSLERKQSITLVFGISAVILGFLFDLYFASQNKPLIGGTGLGPYGLAIEALCQYILIALRNDAAHHEARRLQKQLVVTLQQSEDELKQKVHERTLELQDANTEISSAYKTADALRIKAETAREQTAQALEKLQSTQAQLIQAEKMASLGLLVSNVAHEINTPNGAIQSSGQTVADSMEATLDNLPQLLDTLSRAHRDLFLQLVSHAKGEQPFALSMREERTVTKKLTTELEAAGVADGKQAARLLIKLGAHQQAQTYLPLLTSPDTDLILRVATAVADVLSGTRNINLASGRIGQIVASLKQLSGNDRVTAMFETPVHRSIEAAISTLENKLHNVDVVRRYQDVRPLRCDPEALQQAWTHLISNAAHASSH
jgi:signal transduction histidine kinase